MNPTKQPATRFITAFPAPSNIRAVFVNDDDSEVLEPVISLAVIEWSFSDGKAIRLDGFGEDKQRFGECSNFSGFRVISPLGIALETVSKWLSKAKNAALARFTLDAEGSK